MKAKQEQTLDQPLVNFLANGRLLAGTETKSNLFLKFLGGLLGLLGMTAVLILPVHATNITVTTTDDEVNSDGDCSLREAIIAANTDTAVDACPAGSGTDTIVLPAGTYVLALPGINEDSAQLGDLDITDDLVIEGAGKNNTIIDANGLDRVFHVLFGEVQISKVTVTGGNADKGGGIYLQGGAVSLVNSRVTNNVASADYGGGILVYIGSNTLTLLGTTVSNNSAKFGAGIATILGTVTLTNSLVQGNSAVVDGGGIYNLATDLTVINSTISGNEASASGGGIFFHGVNVTVVAGFTKVYNGTLYNNSALTGGGVYLFSGFEDFSLQNSIIAGNFHSGGGSPDCFGTFASEGYNLIQSVSNCVLLGDPSGNVTGVTPFLSPLQDNGGPTLTHAFFLSSSQAVDGGNPAGCMDPDNNLLGIDQRGYARPVDGNGDGQTRCDMGAFEFNSPGTPTPTPLPTSTPTAQPTETPDPSQGEDHALYLPLIVK